MILLISIKFLRHNPSLVPPNKRKKNIKKEKTLAFFLWSIKTRTYIFFFLDLFFSRLSFRNFLLTQFFSPLLLFSRRPLFSYCSCRFDSSAWRLFFLKFNSLFRPASSRTSEKATRLRETRRAESWVLTGSEGKKNWSKVVIWSVTGKRENKKEKTRIALRVHTHASYKEERKKEESFFFFIYFSLSELFYWKVFNSKSCFFLSFFSSTFFFPTYIYIIQEKYLFSLCFDCPPFSFLVVLPLGSLAL